MTESGLSDFLSGMDPEEADRPPAAGVGRGARAAPEPETPEIEQPPPTPPGTAETTTAPTEASSKPPKKSRKERILIEGRYEVHAESPLEHLNTGGALAYNCSDQRQSNRPLVAYLCRPGLPIRLDLQPSMMSMDHPTVQRMVAFGAVQWPPEKGERPFLVYDRPRGKRMMASPTDKRTPMNEDQITRQVLRPISQALREFKQKRIFHGGLNPLNLYGGEGGDMGLQLGECVSAPPGFGQPTVFETISRGMAMPAGRGAGAQGDDLYALGVVILTLLWGQVPMAGVPDQQIITAKVAMGSYGALIGDKRLPLNLMEPVKGLLLDDPSQRWSLDDLDLWISGRRLSPKQPQPTQRASRALEFDGTGYVHPHVLAHAMGSKPVSAAKLMDSGDLLAWLDRSLDDDQILKKVQEGIATAKASRGGTEMDRRVSRVILAMDPGAPMRFRGKSVLPEGMGAALADAMMRGDTVQPIAEIMLSQLPMWWVNVQRGFRAEHVPVVRLYDQMRMYMERGVAGYGVERCLYELNPYLSCQSHMMDAHFVTSIPELLDALDAVAEHKDRPKMPFDRHIAAFILARGGKVDEGWIQTATEDKDSAKRMTAVIQVLESLQRNNKHGPLPSLTAWLSDLIRPALEVYHSRTMRTRVEEEMQKQAELGYVQGLLVLLQSANLRNQDEIGFQRAQRVFLTADRRIEMRRKELSNKTNGLKIAGYQMAAIVSTLISGLTMVVSFVTYVR